MTCIPKHLAATLILCSGLVHAGVNTYTDWAIACDNTRHCEAYGYQAESDEHGPVTLFLSRDAGPATPVKASLMVQAEDEKQTGRLTIKVGKVSVKGLLRDGELTAAQINMLLPPMLNASEATLTDGKSNWVLSLAGMKAALLKMDEQQGRVGTPGALVRKGAKAESSVLPALPAPVLVPASIAAPKANDEKLLAPILKAVKDRDCWENIPDERDPDMSIQRLSATQVLVLRECMRGAYQGSSAAWVANDKPPYSPRRLTFQASDGGGEEFVTNADFDKGVMHSYAKGRGLADCMATADWLWTADGFKLLAEDVAPLCRGIPGGGYSLRTWTAVQKK